MLDGTYYIRTYLAKDDFEENTMVLYTKDGVLNGYIAEIVFRPVPLENGTVNGDAFAFEGPLLITIVGDLAFRMSGECKDGKISGFIALATGKIPFAGKRIGDPKIPGRKS